MKLSTFLGAASWAGAAGLFGYQSLRSLMQKDNVWNEIVLKDAGLDFINSLPDSLPVESMKETAAFIINDLPLYQFLLATGLVLLIIGALFKK